MAAESVEDEVKALSTRGVAVQLVEADGQSYALVEGLTAPTPPWDQTTYDVLIAIPAAYELGGVLDAFYFGLPYTFNGGTHPRVQGAIITVLGRQWQLVSWHYPDAKPWQRGRDDLGSHIIHCQGFFYDRGAENDYH